MALVVALMMVLAGVAALADDPTGAGAYEHTDTINVVINDNTHGSYKAIQIFAGTQEINGTDNNPLGDIVWGADVAGYEAKIIAAVNTAFGTSLSTTAGSLATAKEVAEAIAVTKNGTATTTAAFDDSKAKDLAQLLARELGSLNGTNLVSNTDNNVPIGYYLVMDKTELNTTNPNKGDALNASLLQFTKNITINKKSDAPNIEKKIVSDDGTTLVDSNTATIGDEITYQIEGTIPDATYYDHYYYVINDTLSTGLTFQNNVKVFKSVTTGTGAEAVTTETQLVKGTDYYEYDNYDGKTFVIAFADIKKAQATDTEGLIALPAGTKIVVRYTALLNSNAVIGETGNPNEVTLKYSNNPDKSEKKDKDNDHPGIPDTSDTTVFGETPEDITITYTAQVKVIKKAKTAEGNALPGAVFTLTGTSKKPVVKEIETYVVDAAGTYYRLTNGTYTTTAPTTDAMTEKGKGNAVTSGYVIDNQYTDADKVVIGSTTYRPYVAATDNSADVQVYTLTGGTAAQYASTTTKYKKDTVTTTTYNEVQVQFTGTSDANGIIEFKDLGAGTYTLAEIVVPDGYNKADDETFEIKASIPGTVSAKTDKATWTVDGTDATDFTVTSATGLYSTTIVDTQGATLPETGGVGTTIFYVAGSILVLAAAILLITKRRMGSED